MVRDKVELLNAMDSWSVDERLEFIDAVYERLAVNGWSPDAEPEVWAEVERRLAEHERDSSSVISWEEAETRLKANK
jgi:putative addiction module component (TIGR02574 family)